MPRFASGFFMNVFQMKPVRRFSAISMVIPVSIPTTSGSDHFFSGLNASTNPYRHHVLSPYLSRIVRKTRRHAWGRNGSDPPAAAGVTDPSIRPTAGGPPHATYPYAESD